MEGKDVSGVATWLRSLKLEAAADNVVSNGIDGFVMVALLEEEGGLESIGITSIVDRAKVRGGVKKLAGGVSNRPSLAKDDFAPSAAPRSVPPLSSQSVVSSKMKAMIKVPQKVVNAGQDFKFNPAPELVDLKGWMEEDEYNSAILTVNDKVKSARATSLDAVLLAGGAGMLPLIPWGVRHYRQKKKHKKLLLEAIDDFNERNKQNNLRMRWWSKPVSELTIERVSTKGGGSPADGVEHGDIITFDTLADDFKQTRSNSFDALDDAFFDPRA